MAEVTEDMRAQLQFAFDYSTFSVLAGIVAAEQDVTAGEGILLPEARDVLSEWADEHAALIVTGGIHRMEVRDQFTRGKPMDAPQIETAERIKTALEDLKLRIAANGSDPEQTT